jgi:hypothetical protein
MNGGEDIPRREYYQRVIAGLGPLQKLMLDLEVAVLQKPPELIVQQYHHMPDTLEKWMAQPGGNPIWYMGDGGYSRVVWNTENGNLFLTDNSTSKAKANWDKAMPQREVVKNYLNSEYERLSSRERSESRAERIVDMLLEIQVRDTAPPKPVFDDPDNETEFYTRNPFTAYSHALDKRRHHPKLWQVVRGSVYEPQYRKMFGDQIRESGPRMKALKKGRTPLSDVERKEVERRKACWDDGHPGVWKSRVNGKTYYVCNTHRAMQVKPTLKGAIKAFTFIKSTA